MRLRAVKEEDQSLIHQLQSRIDELEGQLAAKSAELSSQKEHLALGVNEAVSSHVAEIRRRDSQIADLKRSVKDQEREIARLNDAVSGWQKKYEFLSAEPPAAYQSQTVSQEK